MVQLRYKKNIFRAELESSRLRKETWTKTILTTALFLRSFFILLVVVITADLWRTQSGTHTTSGQKCTVTTENIPPDFKSLTGRGVSRVTLFSFFPSDHQHGYSVLWGILFLRWRGWGMVDPFVQQSKPQTRHRQTLWLSMLYLRAQEVLQ